MTEDAMIDRIRNRLKELKLTPRAASLRAGGSPDMFRIVLSGRSQNPRRDTLSKIATALKVDEQWLLHGDGPAPQPAQDLQKPARTRTETTPLKDVPIMGTAFGSIIKDSFEGLDIGGPVDYAPRPPALAQARDIYAIYVSGESMAPQHNPGDLRFIHPHRPVQPGCSVVVQTRQWNDDPGQAYIKTLEKRSGDKLVLSQINPPATIEIPMEHVARIHRVLTVNELFGV